MDRSHVYGVELSRLRNLSRLHVPLRKIHFRLESDTLPVRDSYIDLYIPQFHRYDPGGDSSIRHLDVTTTWRGLSVSHAEELKFWEEMFAAVLEYTISNYLIEVIDSMDDCNIDRYPGDLDSRICSFANKLGSKTLPVNIREINSCMMQLHQRHGPQYQWLACTGNLHNTLCEFLRTRECFLDTPLDPSVQVTFSACLSGQGEPNIVGTLQRYGPSLRFHRLDTSTNDGAWCSIHPSYVEQVLNPAYPSFLGRPEYHLTSDWIKFNWEGDHEGFLGYVRPIPHTGPKGTTQPASTPLNVDLSAVSKRFFLGGVVLERHVRVRLTLTVSRASRVPTASPGSLPSLHRCKEQRSLFSSSPLILSPVKHSCLPSVPALEKSVWAGSPPEKRWGKNVPAWSILPGKVMPNLEERVGLVPSLDPLSADRFGMRPSTFLRGNTCPAQSFKPYRGHEKQDLRPTPPALRDFPPLPESSIQPAREEGSESEYMVIQPTHTNSSLQNLSLS
ncbi:hypothetical protein B0J12DRAFT_449271 [Macrophomina phaseolina]|uniref:Uncharacterized protein n=1 Tax=Macrophomina phaseolina TaxID=35725 RepID=A0ABQ8GI53_9PEZI|nr:hypothetical protein B0J12DRAFT_449271 [Macrophomina phaseolina]